MNYKVKIQGKLSNIYREQKGLIKDPFNIVMQKTKRNIEIKPSVITAVCKIYRMVWGRWKRTDEAKGTNYPWCVFCKCKKYSAHTQFCQNDDKFMVGFILLCSCVCDVLSSSSTLHVPRTSSTVAFSTAPFLGGRTCINASFQDFPAVTSKRISNTVIQRRDTDILLYGFLTGDFLCKNSNKQQR